MPGMKRVLGILLAGVIVSLMMTNKEVIAQIDNLNKVYNSFPTFLRQPNPQNPPSIDGGPCCDKFEKIHISSGKSAKFISPNYPSAYPSEINCGWRFTTDPGYVLDLYCHVPQLQRNDYIYMKDSKFGLDSHVENVMDKQVYHHFWGNDVMVGFKSDEVSTSKGFECKIWPVKNLCSIAPYVPSTPVPATTMSMMTTTAASTTSSMTMTTTTAPPMTTTTTPPMTTTTTTPTMTTTTSTLTTGIYSRFGPILVINGRSGTTVRGTDNNVVDYINCAQVNNNPLCVDKSAANGGSTSNLAVTLRPALYNNMIYACQWSDTHCYKADATVFPLSFVEILPRPLSDIYSLNPAVVNDEIWFNSNTKKLMVLDTKTDTLTEHVNTIEKFDFACIVHKNGVTYAIGAGQAGDEIWKNTDSSQKTAWTQVGTYPQVTFDPACIWIDHMIYATGGRNAGLYKKTVAKLDTRNEAVTAGPELPAARANHQMAVINNRIAVIGGTSDGTNRYESILTLNPSTNNWDTSSLTISSKRSHFGVIQYPST